MIRRVEDNNILNEDQLNKLAEIVDKKNNVKLFDIVEDQEKLNLIKKELRIQGYQVKIEPFGDKWKVYAVIPERVEFRTAVDSGQFKKLAWGRYCFQRESSLGMFKYDYDDGSIWKVMVGEDGKEYLIKEIDSDDENDIVRVKTANNADECIVDDNNVDTVLSILYDDMNKVGELTNDIAKSNIKNSFYSFLNDKLNKDIDLVVESNKFIKSQEYISDLKGIIKIAVNSKDIKCKQQLSQLIVEYTDNVITKMGKNNKLFD